VFQAHKLIPIHTNTDCWLVAFCTWIPTPSALVLVSGLLVQELTQFYRQILTCISHSALVTR
jgi:hypothetical protein